MTLAASLALDRRALETYQLDRLRELFETALAGDSFYSAKLRESGVEAPPQSLAEFRERTPFTLKQELVDDQLRNPPYGSNLSYPLERYSRFSQTSGTTATPLRWLDTREGWDWMLDCWERVYEAAEVSPRDRLYFPFSFGPFLGFWAAFEASTRRGNLSIPGGGARSEARLRTILDNDVTVLCATPTYAIRLAEAAIERGLDLSASRVRRIIVAGEPGGSIPSTRATIERLWPGAQVLDHHGMTEIGPVSYECPRLRGVLHVIGTAYLAEVIDPETLQPVEPGEVGELTLTNLGRLGSPLIRYRTRDQVRRARRARCECGSEELALEGGILGRTDDMVVIRGVNVHPSAVEEILRGDGGVAEFRAEVRTGPSFPEMSLEIEPAPSVRDESELVRRLAAALHRAFSLRVSVKCVPHGTLPRFEMKARRWLRR